MTNKREWAEMSVSGLLKWVHRLVMLITFPFRKFWQIVFALLIILAILIATPMCYGVKFRDVWDWYKIKFPTHEFVEVKDQAKARVTEKIKSVRRKVNGIFPTVVQKPENTENAEDEVRFVSWNVAEFNKAKYKPSSSNVKVIAESSEKTFAEIKKDAQKDNTPKVFEIKKQAASAQPNNPNFVTDKKDLSSYYVKLEDQNLEYLTEPEILTGKMTIVTPNDVYIQDTFVYLYGVYCDPNIYDTDLANNFLQTLVADENVHCDVIAYTTQTKVATALCFVNDTFINKALVDNDMAENVALK
ncbi:MAG: hypothetical protein MJ212_02210 [Alphaproteobacteria bacterium]|nr:hypothetical protein [Alphaproteobacteria bacterium]